MYNKSIIYLNNDAGRMNWSFYTLQPSKRNACTYVGDIYNHSHGNTLVIAKTDKQTTQIQTKCPWDKENNK